ncbi:hypothetical protein [Streptomyces niveus]|uniref:hypothetical protein n=1 Tax=Streptomyces niveus TaxID=193462 RepID=UPI00365C1EC5
MEEGIVFNVFVDDMTGRNVAVFSPERAYDASALANHFVDAGYRVDTDLWGSVVPDAMMSPAVAALAFERIPLTTI